MIYIMKDVMQSLCNNDIICLRVSYIPCFKYQAQKDIDWVWEIITLGKAYNC